MSPKIIALFVLLAAVLVLLNSWTYLIAEESAFLSFILVWESFLMVVAFYVGNSKLLNIIVVGVMVVLSLFFLTASLDRQWIKESNEDIMRKSLRHEYFSVSLGKVYQNRVGIFVFNDLRRIENKLSERLLSFLDIKMPILLVLPAVVGFFVAVMRPYKLVVLVLCLLVFVTSLLSLTKSGPVLMYPVANLFSVVGLVWTISKLHSLRK